MFGSIVGRHGRLGHREEAVRQAIDLAKQVGSVAGHRVRVRAVSVTGCARSSVRHPRTSSGQSTARRTSTTRWKAARTRRAGVEVETFARQGDPADAILDVAEERGSDLIVVGNKGMTGAKRFLLGSVPNKVSHHAPCSVLIIRTT